MELAILQIIKNYVQNLTDSKILNSIKRKFMRSMYKPEITHYCIYQRHSRNILQTFRVGQKPD